jgi:hypothetical protein
MKNTSLYLKNGQGRRGVRIRYSLNEYDYGSRVLSCPPAED